MKRVRQFLVALVLSGLAAIAFSAPADAQVPAGELEVVLAIDTSGSMRPAIDAAKAAANEFVRSMPPELRIGVETFGDAVTVLTPPTTDRAVLSELINAIVADGDTALYDAVVTAGQQFTPTVEHKVLVLLSDGKDDGSMATLDDAIAAVQGVHVEAISLTTAETDLYSLLALGPVTSADDAAGVSAAFARVASLVVDVVIPTIAAPTTPAPATTVDAPTTPAPATTIAAPAAPAPTTPAPTTPPTLAAPAATVERSRPPDPAASDKAATTPDSSPSLWVGALGIFCGLFLLGWLLFPRDRVSKARLGIDKPRNVSEMGRRTVSAVEDALERRGKRTELATTLAVANISMQPGEFLGIVAVVAVVVGLVALLISGPVGAVLVVTTVCLGVRVYVARTKAKRQVAFADQLPDVMQLVTTALRSGFGLTQALDSVAEEAEEPARSEFAHVLVESRLGRDLSDAMRALAQRMGSKDLEWVVAAIDINRDTGGNLSEILNTVGATIRERQRMARQVDTLTAEGRLSARILTAMPFLMALLQWRTNPDNFALLTHGGGLVAVMVAGILMILGTFWVHKIVNSLAL
jgi:tight adherence protein B